MVGYCSIRYRVCANPFPINRGPNCPGKSFAKEPCNSLPSCQGSPPILAYLVPRERGWAGN